MTTIRDLLNDLIEEVQDKTPMLQQKLTEEERENLLDEYIETIKERLIG